MKRRVRKVTGWLILVPSALYFLVGLALPISLMASEFPMSIWGSDPDLEWEKYFLRMGMAVGIAVLSWILAHPRKERYS